MRRVPILAVAAMLALASIPAWAQGGQVVAINGPAYRYGPPHSYPGPIQPWGRFQPANPSAATIADLLAGNARYAATAPAAPRNIQVSASRSGITNTIGFINDFTEPMLAADPNNPNHLVGGSKFFTNPQAYQFWIGAFESVDAGRSWTEMQLPNTSHYSITSDIAVAFDDLGNAYLSMLTRSPDGYQIFKLPAGQPGNWNNGVLVSNPGADKGWIAADWFPNSPCKGDVYVTWSGLYFSRSTDRGATFSAARTIGSGEYPYIAVAPDSTVYVSANSGNGFAFYKSTNCGQTFTTVGPGIAITEIPYILPNGTFRNWNFSQMAISPTTGTIFVTWNDYRNGDADILLSKSTNGAQSWSSPVRLNDDALGDGIDQFQPQISAAPDGHIAVSFFDRRLPCPQDDPVVEHRGDLNTCIDTSATRSTDDGATWTANRRASAKTWEPALNAPCPQGNCSVTFIGDYQGLAATRRGDYPFFNSTANLGQNPDNWQEIFTTLLR